MKKPILLLFSLFLLHSFSGAKPYVQFDSQKFVEAWTNDTEAEKVREFLREGDTLKSWSKMITKRTFPNLKKPKDYVSRLVGLIRKNPMNMCEVYKKKKAYMVDFLVHAPDFSYSEWNLMKVEKTSYGVVVWQYAYRLSGDDWAEHLRSERARIGDILGNKFEETNQGEQVGGDNSE